MSTLSIRLPDSLHQQLKEAAQQEGVSINQLVLMAVTRQVSALHLANLIERHGGPVSPQEFLSLLDSAGDAPLREGDELPANFSGA